MMGRVKYINVYIVTNHQGVDGQYTAYLPSVSLPVRLGPPPQWVPRNLIWHDAGWKHQYPDVSWHDELRVEAERARVELEYADCGFGDIDKGAYGFKVVVHVEDYFAEKCTISCR